LRLFSIGNISTPQSVLIFRTHAAGC